MVYLHRELTYVLLIHISQRSTSHNQDVYTYMVFRLYEREYAYLNSHLLYLTLLNPIVNQNTCHIRQ